MKEEDSSKLKANNAQLKLRINDMEVMVKAQDEEIRQLWAKTEGIEKIREFIGHTSDVLTKAHLFDNEVKTEDHLSIQKIISILMKYKHKIEVTLRKMRKLLPGSSVSGTSQPPIQATVPLSPKKKVQQLLDNLKGCLQEPEVQEVVAGVVKILVPTPEDSLAAVPEVMLKGKN